jgi:hypothetical protein
MANKRKEKKGIFETLSVQLSDDIKLKSQIIKSQNCMPTFEIFHIIKFNRHLE